MTKKLLKQECKVILVLDEVPVVYDERQQRLQVDFTPDIDHNVDIVLFAQTTGHVKDVGFSRLLQLLCQCVKILEEVHAPLWG